MGLANLEGHRSLLLSSHGSLSKHRSLFVRVSAAEPFQWLPRCSTRLEPIGMPWRMSDARLPHQQITAAPQPLLECGLTAAGVKVRTVQRALGQMWLWSDSTRG